MISSNRLDIRDLTYNQLKDFLGSINIPSYRARQIFAHLYKKGLHNFDDMSDIPLILREALKENFYIYQAGIVKKQISGQDRTVKYLLSLREKNLIECVLIRGFRNTLCLSTQIGCRFGCAFCASTKGEFVRNLKCSEVLEQFLAVERDIAPIRINNIVFMGMGEPLDNVDNLIKAVEILNSEYGPNIGIRKITVSTCGLISGIRRLINSDLTPELSISLHAPSDKVRNSLMPINRKFNIDDLIKIAKEYTQKTKRMVTFEYILIKGINDSPQQARELMNLIKCLKCKLNLIVYNKIESSPYESPVQEKIMNFYKILKSDGISVTLRKSKGRDIEAACGQLRLKYLIQTH